MIRRQMEYTHQILYVRSTDQIRLLKPQATTQQQIHSTERNIIAMHDWPFEYIWIKVVSPLTQKCASKSWRFHEFSLWSDLMWCVFKSAADILAILKCHPFWWLKLKIKIKQNKIIKNSTCERPGRHTDCAEVLQHQQGFVFHPIVCSLFSSQCCQVFRNNLSWWQRVCKHAVLTGMPSWQTDGWPNYVLGLDHRESHYLAAIRLS